MDKKFQDLEKELKEIFKSFENSKNKSIDEENDTFDECCVEKLKRENKILSDKYNKLKKEYNSLKAEYDRLSNDVDMVLDIIDLFIMFLDASQGSSKKTLNFKASSKDIPFDISNFLN
jgi:predicted nuclease with TOPRIM domain